MKKVFFALGLFFFSWVANAITVTLVQHNQTAGSGTISTLITDGSHIQGQPASTAVWDWDGTTLTSSGLYSQVGSIGSSPNSATILNDQITDLSINTATQTASATAYSCVEGTFLSTVGASGCGGHNLGANFTNETTTVWGPGTAVSQTLGGDDVLTGGGPRDISAYDFQLTSWNGTTLVIGNGIAVGSTSATQGNGEAMIFQTAVPVPAAAWLFGSALAFLGWARRRSGQ